MAKKTNEKTNLNDMPLIQHRLFKSKDGKYIVSQLRISSIKPTAYYEKLLDSDADEGDLF